jgi:hypothetical protein
MKGAPDEGGRGGAGDETVHMGGRKVEESGAVLARVQRMEVGKGGGMRGKSPSTLNTVFFVDNEKIDDLKEPSIPLRPSALSPPSLPPIKTLIPFSFSVPPHPPLFRLFNFLSPPSLFR